MSDHIKRRVIFDESPRCELILGNSLDILPTIERVDTVITDTPYGINFQYDYYDDSLDAWKAMMTILVTWCRYHATNAAMPSCQIGQMQWIYEHIRPDWLICWYKGSPGHCAAVGFNDWEPILVYGKPDNFPIHDYFQVAPETQSNGHPCPKSIKWATWLIERFAGLDKTVIDPFMGSGTTGVAAYMMHRPFIGIELSEAYFEICVNRITKDRQQLPLITEVSDYRGIVSLSPTADQWSLFED